MITAVFYKSREGFRGVAVSGHAGWASGGSDVACAAVSSAVQFTANGITEVLRVPAQVSAEDNLVRIQLPENPCGAAADFLDALRLHLELLSQDYPKTIHLTILEV